MTEIEKEYDEELKLMNENRCIKIRKEMAQFRLRMAMSPYYGTNVKNTIKTLDGWNKTITKRIK